MSDDVYKPCLAEKFGFQQFRPFQKDIIDAILQGRDVFCRMATGHGKSLCYQFPPVFSNKIALIISPLISLMEDQQSKLAKQGISACAYNSLISCKQLVNHQLLEGKYSLIYVAPETLSTNKEFFQAINDKHHFCLAAVDEAHCISMWGTTFRPEYKNLSCLREWFPNVPILALTGTATNLVETDIYEGLGLKNALKVSTSANRENLSYYVYKKGKDVWQDLGPVLKVDESVIIYCATREMTENIARLLTFNNYKALAYHAGMNSVKRKQVQEAFMKDEVRIIVATISFGMGVDKPDIRKVIHYTAPSSCEAYVQETGRAGRDGLLSTCITFYSEKDFQINKSHLVDIVDPAIREHRLRLQSKINCYLTIATCRRQYLLAYFDEVLVNKPTICCDNCSGNSVVNEKDVTFQTRAFLTMLHDYPFKYGKTMYIDALLGRKLAKIPDFLKTHSSYGSALDLTLDNVKFMVTNLIQDGYINERKITSSKYGACTIGPTPKAENFLSLNEMYTISLSTKTIQKPKFIASDINTKIDTIIDKTSDAKKIKLVMIEEKTSGTTLLKKTPEKEKKISTSDVTYNMFVDGLDLKDIASYRTLKLQTIEGHIAQAISVGKVVDFERIGINKVLYEKIIKVLEEIGSSEKLKPIKEKLGRGVSYFAIKACIEIHKAGRQEELK